MAINYKELAFNCMQETINSTTTGMWEFDSNDFPEGTDLELLDEEFCSLFGEWILDTEVWEDDYVWHFSPNLGGVIWLFGYCDPCSDAYLNQNEYEEDLYYEDWLDYRKSYLEFERTMISIAEELGVEYDTFHYRQVESRIFA